MRPLSLVSSAVLLLGIAPSGLGPAATVDPSLTPGILATVAEVASERATLWVRGDGAEPLRIRYATADGGDAAHDVIATPAVSRDLTARVPLEGLRPGTRYAYEIAQGPTSISGEFGTAPAPAADAPVRFMWSADLGGAGHCRDVEDGYRIFRPMADQHPDFFLFAGDTIYADHLCGRRSHAAGADFAATTLPQYHAKHRYNREDPQVQRFFRMAPVYAIWDDHEVRNDFDGPRDPLMPVGRQAFLDYFPIVGPRQEPYRLYRSIRWGRHVEVFIVDTRQYRSPKAATDGPDKTMLGEEQRAWLLARLTASDATWKFVVSSLPLGMFTGGRMSDSWSSANLLGFPRHTGSGYVFERDLILSALGERRVRNLVFLTGEVHHAELIRHEPSPGWVFHEFSAGPLSARQGYPRPLDRSLHPRSLGSLGWTENFGRIDADGERLQVKIVDASGDTRVGLTLPAQLPVTQARR